MVKYELTIPFDEAYLEQCYSDRMALKGSWGKANLGLGLVLIVVGLAIAAFRPEQLSFAGGLAGLGVFELVLIYLRKGRWIRRQKSSKAFGSDMTLAMTDSVLHISTPYSETSYSWTAFTRIKESENGVFLWPREGMHIYIPKPDLSDDALSFVLAHSG